MEPADTYITTGKITFESGGNASTLKEPAPDGTLFIHVDDNGEASLVISKFYIGHRDSDGQESYACDQVFVKPYDPEVDEDTPISRWKSIPARELYPVDLDTHHFSYQRIPPGLKD